MTGTYIAVAMSGGVDSTVAAALLKDAGHEVVGLSMQLLCTGENGSDRVCGMSRDIEDARQACDALGIPHRVVDLEREFAVRVVEAFCREYAEGRTPNPCIMCNQQMKFGALMQEALSLGARYLATGHYARVEEKENRFFLLKGTDRACDQSYFLYMLRQDDLRHVQFPVGSYRKSEVRKMAEDRGLSVAQKRKSQDICFVASGNYRDLLAERGLLGPGKIIDESGAVLGTHGGTALYTIGQRKGLGISGRRRLFVLAIDPCSRTVKVGPESSLLASEVRAGRVSYVADAPPGEIHVTAKVRYGSPEVGAVLYPQGDAARVVFDVPQRAVTPGQAIVFYDGELVLGGGIMEAS